jgi:hypothetical protein
MPSAAVSKTYLRKEAIVWLPTSCGRERKVRAPLIGSYTHKAEEIHDGVGSPVDVHTAEENKATSVCLDSTVLLEEASNAIREERKEVVVAKGRCDRGGRMDKGKGLFAVVVQEREDVTPQVLAGGGTTDEGVWF